MGTSPTAASASPPRPTIRASCNWAPGWYFRNRGRPTRRPSSEPMNKTALLFLAWSCAWSAMPNRPPLQKNAFDLLPLKSVKPKGWLLDQLRIQANVLSGHLDEFWPDVGPHTAWLGGNGEGWARGPYFLDGLVPLAYLTDDPRLITKVNKW